MTWVDYVGATERVNGPSGWRRLPEHRELIVLLMIAVVVLSVLLAGEIDRGAVLEAGCQAVKEGAR